MATLKKWTQDIKDELGLGGYISQRENIMGSHDRQLNYAD
jgi:hypothetical protein